MENSAKHITTLQVTRSQFFTVYVTVGGKNAKKNNAVAFPYGRRQQPQTALTPSPRIAKGCNSAAPRRLQPRHNVRSGETTAATRVNNNC